MRARKCRVSSTLETCRRSAKRGEFADGKVVQHRAIYDAALLDDPRNNVQSRLHLRRVSLILLMLVVSRPHRAAAAGAAVQRMRHRFDAARLGS